MARTVRTARRATAPREQAANADVVSAAANPADAWSAATRHQMECSMHAFVAVLESTEAMHRFLLDMTQDARKRHEAAWERVHSADGMEQLVELQAEMWRFDTDIAGRYGSELMEAITHMQAEIADQGTRAMEMWFGDAQRSIGGFAPATMLPTAMAPAAMMPTGMMPDTSAWTGWLESWLPPGALRALHGNA